MSVGGCSRRTISTPITATAQSRPKEDDEAATQFLASGLMHSLQGLKMLNPNLQPKKQPKSLASVQCVGTLTRFPVKARATGRPSPASGRTFHSTPRRLRLCKQ